MKTLHFVLAVFVLCSSWLRAQSVLDSYVKKGLENNQTLQQKNLSLQKAMLALKQANRLFAPSITAMADYQSGEGGRSISLPIGDLLNPVYGTLNQLTQSNNFPTVENVDTYFFPKNFYDLKVRTTMPLLNTDIVYNRKIQEEKMSMTVLEADIYKRSLERDIRVAYYNYSAATEAVLIVEAALNTAQQQNVQTKKLIEQGLAIPAAELRTESEVLAMQAKLSEAKQQQQNAAAYFNFLINVPLQDVIQPDASALQADSLLAASASRTTSGSGRPELTLLQHAITANKYALQLQRATWLPKLSAFADLGSQASDFKFNTKSRYYFFGVSLSMPLFTSGRNLLNTKQSQLDLKAAELQQSQVNTQLQLAQRMATNALLSARSNAQSAALRSESAQTYYNLLAKGYKQGTVSHIEIVDAANQALSAKLANSIAKQQLQIAVINFKYEHNQ